MWSELILLTAFLQQREWVSSAVHQIFLALQLSHLAGLHPMAALWVTGLVLATEL